MKYSMIVKFKTRELLKSVEIVEDVLNKDMSGMGLPEFYLESTYPLFELDVSRVLTDGEQSIIINELNETFREKEMKYECVGMERL